MPADAPTLGDVIRRFGAALLERRGAAVTPAQRAVLSTLGRCHTAALGGHLYVCDACGVEHVAYNSCGNRHCPSCLHHKSAAWLQDRTDELLPVPYFHVVFTVPEEIAALALGNKKAVYSILFRAASETLLEIGADPKHLGATLGFLAILHTWTQTMQHHPHVHCIVPGGGLSPDRSQWIKSRDKFLLPVAVLSCLYRKKFLAYLAEAARGGALQFAGVTAPLATAAGFEAFFQKQQGKAWVVYAKPPFGSPERVLKYLARYTHRVAISDRRIHAIQGDTVTFGYRDNASGLQRDMTLDGVEFLRRFVLHVLPRGFVRIRYFGLFANRVRAINVTRCRELLAVVATGAVSAGDVDSACVAPGPASQPEDDRRRRCPACGTGTLLWIASLAPVPAHDAVTHAPTPPDTS